MRPPWQRLPLTGTVATTLGLQIVARDAYGNPVKGAVGPSDVDAFVTFPRVGLGPYVPTSLEGSVGTATVTGGQFPTASFSTGMLLLLS